MNGRNVLIFKSVVETRNSAAVSRLVDLLPDSAKLDLQKGFEGTIYDYKTKRDYWIACNDHHVMCLMITGIRVDEVSKIRAVLDQPGESSLDIDGLVSQAERVTGGKAHLMWPRPRQKPLDGETVSGCRHFSGDQPVDRTKTPLVVN
jgi:hypothetical protein